MNYNWDWGVFFKSTGIGSETYLDWYIAGLGWTIAIALVGWIIALALGSLLGVMRTVPNRLVSGIATAYVDGAGLDTVMTNSFGFGGTNGSMLLSRYNG